jgi:hypothetical protein
MKNLLVLATMLLTFGFAKAQCKIYRGDSNYWKDQIATLKDGKIYKGDSTYWKDQIGTYSGGESCGAAAAFVLLLW